MHQRDCGGDGAWRLRVLASLGFSVQGLGVRFAKFGVVGRRVQEMTVSGLGNEGSGA